ncbi:MAG: WGR domain-containing protein [Rhizobium sp.]|nr:WGR domain-containing protein [Rhizobium sp.]
MSKLDKDIVHLHRIDPARNMARFYLVTLETTLFGEIVLRRTWGRIGTSGQYREDTVRDRSTAVRRAVEIAVKKRRRGYRDPEPRPPKENLGRMTRAASSVVREPSGERAGGDAQNSTR